jgi:hypothetical protein
MPITDFQRDIFKLLKSGRSPDSYVAGGTAIHRDAQSLRYSNDIDFFHDSDEAVTLAYDHDTKALKKAGYNLQVLILQPSFYRVIVAKGDEQVLLEWVRDTAFRFFPVVDDPDLGYRLHDADLAVNKCLALANRSEIRDAIDILHIDNSVMSMAACCWAACGKDPGYTPDLILDMIQRHAQFSPDQIQAESLVRPLDPVALKKSFSKLISASREALKRLNPVDLGCLYVDKKGFVVGNLDKLDPKKHQPHFGSLKGSWPRIV